MDKEVKDKLLWNIEMMRSHQDRTAHYQARLDMAHVFAQSRYYQEKRTFHLNRAEEHFEEIKDILDAL